MPDRELSLNRILRGLMFGVIGIYLVGTIFWAFIDFTPGDLVCNFFDSVRQCDSAAEYWKTRGFWIVLGLFPVIVVVTLGTGLIKLIAFILRHVSSK